MKKTNKKDEIAKAVLDILYAIGEDPKREGLIRTPRRIADMYGELTTGYKMDAELDVQFAETSDMIMSKDIPFYSMCEHHMVPFFGTADVAYIPRTKVVGASKLPRLVVKYSRRLQVQERMTSQIADELWTKVEPHGVYVRTRARHLCQEMRGIERYGELVVSACRGAMMWNPFAKQEALNL